MTAATISGGGVAAWGKAIPTQSELASFTYETEGTLKVSIDGRPDAYLHAYLTGMDDIDSSGIVRSGFGNAIFTDIDGDTINVKVDWFWDAPTEEDRGRFTLWEGSGKWAGIDGYFDVVLKPALTGDETRFGAFLEGSGEITV